MKLHDAPEELATRKAGKQGSGAFVLRSACAARPCYMSRRESCAPHVGEGGGWIWSRTRQRNTRLGSLIWCDRRLARWNSISDACPEESSEVPTPRSPELWPCDALWWRATVTNASRGASPHLHFLFRVEPQEERNTKGPRLAVARVPDSEQSYQDWPAVRYVTRHTGVALRVGPGRPRAQSSV